MYQFKVNWLFENKEVTDCGLVEGSSYKEAVETLSEYFGEHEMTQCQVMPVGEDDKIILFADGVTDIGSMLKG